MVVRLDSIVAADYACAMTLLYLVRHAKPAATWSEAIDPGLDDEGRAQALATARDLDAKVGAMPVFTSPLQRCVQTALPLSELWKRRAELLPQVAEIPAPPLSLSQRKDWLAASMQGTWPQLQANSPTGSPDYLAWRATMIGTLCRQACSAVIYSHYIAINVAVGAAQGHDRVISFRPAHASVTIIEVLDGRLAVRELGAQADSSIVLGR